jgi:threonine dehydrogenase-like Zn-dependent dehydrogenase
MAELFGGHVVAKYLKEVEEVGVIFSLSGGHIDRIYDGFLEKESASASPFTSFPCVIGHEICGRIDAVGSGVTEVNSGDIVTVAPALNCSAREIDPPCPPCRQGMVANCENYANGNLAPGMITGRCADTGGGFAPYFVAHKSQIFKLPEDTVPETGVLIEPLTVGLQSVFPQIFFG